MDIVQVCEIAMLILFGVSWPFNILKSWRSRTARGKSVIFNFIVVAGYIFGILAKLITYRRTGFFAPATWFYLLDTAMVSVDIALYFRNSALDRKNQHLVVSEE